MVTTVEIEWRGLLLRPWREGDQGVVLRGMTDPEFRRWNTPKSVIADEEDALGVVREREEGWRSGAAATFAVVEDGVVAGGVGLNRIDSWMRQARVSYWTLPEARGRRLASRALEAVTGWAFDTLGLYRLELAHAMGNDASCVVARRCGYLVEGTSRGAMHDPAGGFRPMHLHARLADDPWPAPAAG